MLSSSTEGIPAGTPRHRRGAVRLSVTLTLAAAIPFAVAACGSDSPAAPATTTSAPATTTSAPATTTSAPATTTSAAATQVTVSATEFKFTLSQSTFTAGTYQFAVTDAGQAPHNFIINGPGVDNQKIPVGSPLSAGQSDSGTVTLQAGSYEFYCGVPGHKAKGMTMTVTVT